MPRSKEGYTWTPSGESFGLETEAVVSGTNSSQFMHTYDVIVIGAGYTGLIAARDLSRLSNAKVLILEARDRIGGRTWTASALGEDLEIGGTWFHWNQPHIFAEARRYNLHNNIKTSNGTFGPEKIYFKDRNGKVHKLSEPDVNARIEPIAQKFFSIDGLSSRELIPYPHDPFHRPSPWTRYDHLSMKDRLDQIDGPEEDKAIFEAFMGTIGSDMGSKIAFVEPLRWFALGGHTVSGMFEIIESYKFGPGGQTGFARSILNEYKGHLKFETVVEKIEETPMGVVASACDSESYKAKHVVCTIPLNCLGDIEFSPPLSPLRQEAVALGHQNKGIKVHFKLSAPETSWLAVADPNGNAPFCLVFSDHNGTGQNEGVGAYAIGFGANDRVIDKESSQDIIAGLKHHFRPDVEVAGYVSHDWVNDPFSKGTWSSWTPGCMTKYLNELQKNHGRVVMASSDWADGWRGFIDGAIERGVLAAKQIHMKLAVAGDIESRL
ncbi:unnamed protein product [Clonostachys rosea f. rosea IK726]|uniref:Uncharacterized protein n=1 Tax=Clonostachys rosea f. rosea IK726 TaxID=1349383 RepID=A0ACA9UBQ0_BIOOC|nr:unnamed protein product [Clonostachys rosea f. rosea IK726]